MSFNNFLIYLILFCIFTFSLLKWGIPRALAWSCKHKFNLFIDIGFIKVGMWYVNLCKVRIKKGNITLVIDDIAIKSSMFSSEVAKFISIVVNGVRIQINPVESSGNTKVYSHTLMINEPVLPAAFLAYLPFVSFQMKNLDAMILRTQVPECLLHAAAEEVRFDGSVIHNARIVLLNIILISATAKLLKHAVKNDPRACLCQLSFNLTAETTIRAIKPLSVEKLYLGVDSTKAAIFDGLYSFAQLKTSEKRRGTRLNIAWGSILPIIPKTFTLKIDHTELNGMKDENSLEFSSTLDCFHVNTQVNPSLERNEIKEIFGSVKIDRFHVKCNKRQIIKLSKFTLDGNYEDPKINAYFVLEDLHFLYEHHLMQPWISHNFHHPKKSQNILELHQEESGTICDFFKNCQISGCFIGKKISLSCNLPDNQLTSVGFEDARINLEKTSDLRDHDYNLNWGAVIFGRQHWTLEAGFESTWCKMGSGLVKTDGSMLKKYHTWGTPLFIGSVLIKCRSQNQNEVKTYLAVDIFRTEWSSNFGRFLTSLTDCLDNRKITSTNTSSESRSKIVFTNYVTLTNVNMFFLGDKQICLMFRLDKLTFDVNRGKFDLILEGLKAVSMTPASVAAIQYNCVKSDSIKSMCAHLKNTRINYKFLSRELTAKLENTVQLQWSANLHLKALKLFEDLKSCLSKFTTLKKEKEEKLRLSWAIKIGGECHFLISMPQKHELLLIASELAIGSTKNHTGFETVLLKIAVDDADIFTFKNFEVCRRDDPEVLEERKRNEEFLKETNSAWAITVDSFKAVFPFEHHYADAVQNELVSLWKWLKMLHQPVKTPFTLESPLPPDLNIKIREFLFEMSDDPFEIKLRDNYELLEDEYKESLKRQETLDAKLADLCKTRMLSLPGSKIEELNTNLRKINAEIYIKRSKQMSQTPSRTRLFAWQMTDIHIIALADLSIHGTDRVIKTIRQIDPESPWPEEGLKFTTLWCRAVFTRIKEWKLLLRDFRQPWLLIQELFLFGRLAGAEQEATKRAKRGVSIDLGEPWGSAFIERSMTTLKFYHDFNCEIDQFRYAFGPCWEPVIAQCNLSFEKISPPSRDPSPPMPWWDKMRLLLHGRLTLYTRQLTMLLHASLDPYNTTEEMELTWNGVVMDWTNGKVVFQGDFSVCVRTASKYDDCRLLYLPNLKLTLKLTWVCLSDSNDHHSVMPCAPDKLPEYSSNQEHDSFRAFRSQNLNVSINLETKPDPNRSLEIGAPTAVFFGSTLRWFENLKMILSGVTRPTRRGPVFNNVRPKKKQLSRHYKKVRILVSIHTFQVSYWMSFAMQRGFELLGGRILFGSEHILNLVPIDDGLIHRPRAEWSVSYMNCDLNDAEIWLKSALQDPESDKISPDVEKFYCLSVIKVSYTRETIIDRRAVHLRDPPAHRLVVYDLKGAWTKSNRDVAFALFDTFIKSKQLKKNLSTESLKSIPATANKPRSEQQTAPAATSTPLASTAASTSTPATTASPQTQTAASMLQRLIAEIDSKGLVHSDEVDVTVQDAGQRLRGLMACQEDDVIYKNWLISLINSQVLLKGCETKGYVILSAAKAEILQRVHKPVWNERTLVSKTTWLGSLECMQYYATVAAAGQNDKVDENITWLTVDNIQQKEAASQIADVSDLVGSGQSVGGVVTETVGASGVDDSMDSPIQLQRIVSRCKCEFFYAAYGDTSIDPGTLDEVPSLPMEETGLWEKKETAVDAFTLMHYDLDVCTNSLQYAMILDIVNHLLLYVEPKRKQWYERLQRMRFQLALHSTEDQRKPIQDLQHKVRSEVSRLRRLEKETYLLQKAKDESNDPLLEIELEELNKQVNDCKEALTAKSEELDLMLSCFKESQISANQKLATMKNDTPAYTVRANEIVFKHAKWRLTEADGQLGIADLVLSNFLYTKHSKSDDSVEHLLELGYINVVNLLPNQVYKEVLTPSTIQSNMPVDRKTAVRVFCREKAPVGGISVMEHFEINVVPITIGLTKKFYNTMVAFCFPGRDPDNIEGESLDEVESGEKGGKKTKSSAKKKDYNFYVRIDKKDDVEKMKERAEKNKLFIYIKIPEVPVRVSYKGNKEKNIEDIRDFSLVIPTLEYHNVTWTWLDLLLAMKIDSRRVILSQAIKQKLQIKRKRAVADGAEVGLQSPEEEDKARILFGNRHTAPSTSKGLKKNLVKRLGR